MDIKNVWIVSNYTMPPKYEMRIKNLRYAYYLQKKGISCTLFTASTIHNTKINLITDKSLYIEKEYDGLKYVHIRCSDYSGNGIKRIINMKQFSNRFEKIAPLFKKPDVVLTDVYSPMFRPIFKYCKKYNIPVYIDVRDLWPLSIVAYLGISENNPIISYLYSEEHQMYKMANGIIFAMEGGKQYLIDRKLNDIDMKKVFHINNGIDLTMFQKNQHLIDLQDDDLCNNDFFKIIYIGSVRKVNNLKILCDAAKIIQNSIPKSKIIIYGDGDEREMLIDYCKDNEIYNILFKGFVEKKYIPSILGKGDVNVLNYQDSLVLKYGACQNKIFDYLASGKVTICNAKGHYNLFERFKCGIVTNSFDAKSTAEAIINAYNMGVDERKSLGERAQEVARNYDYSILTDQLLCVFNHIPFVDNSNLEI